MSNNTGIYNAVAFNISTLASRLNRGANGVLTLDGQDEKGVTFLLKKTRSGENPKLTRNELEILRLLNLEEALVPKLDEEWMDDSYGFLETIRIQLINQGASFGDYAEGYILGLVPIEVFLKITLAVKKAVESIHICGVIHNDLHANNVVITLVNNQWKAYVIDFGWSFLEEEGIPSWMERERISWAEEPEDDLKRLVEDLEGRIPQGGEDPDFMEVTGILLK